jgi:peroxiredoxin
VALHSEMAELGSTMPEFALPNVRTGDTVRSSDLAARVNVVVFLCNHCPYVKRIADGLAEFGRHVATDGRVSMVAISSNDVEQYPDDAPDRLAIEADDRGYAFPVLSDQTQEVAAAFDAACTPDFFAYDADHRLAYRGRFDGATPGNDVEVTGEDLRAAVRAILAGEVPEEQIPSMGCGIKWRPAGR